MAMERPNVSECKGESKIDHVSAREREHGCGVVEGLEAAEVGCGGDRWRIIKPGRRGRLRGLLANRNAWRWEAHARVEMLIFWVNHDEGRTTRSAPRC